MPADVIVIVLAAALLHATWNAMAKGRGATDPLIGAVVIAIGSAIVSMSQLTGRDEVVHLQQSTAASECRGIVIDARRPASCDPLPTSAQEIQCEYRAKF